MQYNPYDSTDTGTDSVATTYSDARATFLLRTYAHVCAALSAFALIEVALFKSGVAEDMFRAVVGSRMGWLMVLGAFTLVGWMCSATAHRVQSKPLQYVALAAYVVGKAFIFAPLLYIANTYAPGTIASAAYISFAGFAGLTAVALVTRKDFSFLRGVMVWGGILALIAIVAALCFGFVMGTWFSVAMIGLAGVAILYKTSAVLLHYPEDRYVAASLELFAAVALLFYYVLMLLNRRR